MSIFFRHGLAANKCGKTLAELADTDFVITQKNQFNNDDVVVNWGGNTVIVGGIVLNKPENIKNASDKLKCIQMFPDYVPKTFLEYSDVIQCPFIAKKNFTMRGKGKRIVYSHNAILPKHKREKLGLNCKRFKPGEYDFFQEFLPIKKEYRVVTVAFGDKKRILRTWERVRPEGDHRIHPDWVFTKVQPTPENIKEMAFNVIEKTGLNFVGIDIAETNDRLYLIEINSAPGMNDKTGNNLYSWITKNITVPLT